MEINSQKLFKFIEDNKDEYIDFLCKILARKITSKN